MEETRSKRVKEAVGSTFAGAAVGGIAGKSSAEASALSEPSSVLRGLHCGCL